MGLAARAGLTRGALRERRRSRRFLEQGSVVVAPYPHRIIFVRHGETSYNAENRLQGQRDIPLDGKGREQASAVGRALRRELADELARLDALGAFYASPLVRARQTMELARAALGLAPERYHLSSTLKELTFGDWEGLTWPEVEARDAAGARAREADKWNFAPPRGESYAMLVERVRPWIMARKSDCFVASHGGVARALLFILAGLGADEAASADIWQGRALIFDNGGYAWVG
jgi:probable phosphoglycerate mutase